MDNCVEYPAQFWREALEVAEEFEFDEVDSREQGGLYGLLAEWLSELYTHDTIERDRDRLAAVIDVLEQEGETAFPATRFEQVMESYGGENVSDYKVIGREWIEADCPEDISPTKVSDWKRFCTDNVFREGEVWVENKDSGTFHFFDKHKW
ncbi:hypothetical protein [Streptomyces sp. CBMA156]|uniref:hypothetical protein n=1 Tax=Streptomyces sp. CBMA156 TaxID=1930280 RepID=UPI001661E773|nr:hypothetical protein [Streptomyces sp. CBMA156]MBD0670051.1 hypothetical protein [Streptomyces sp. CBMA156]